MKKTLFALLLAAGCSSTVRTTPEYAGTVESAEECYRHALLQRYDAADANRIESEPEQALENRFGIDVRGETTSGAIAALSSALTAAPRVPPIRIYFIPPQYANLRDDGCAGFYSPPGNILGEQIVLLNVSTLAVGGMTLTSENSNKEISKIATHELAHKITQDLGNSFYEAWRATHTFPYGEGIETHNGGYRWSDNRDGIRDGFIEPYARFSIREDIATLVAAIRHDGFLHLGSRDSTSPPIFERKIRLLREHNFLTQEETEEALGTLGPQERYQHLRYRTLETLASQPPIAISDSNLIEDHFVNIFQHQDCVVYAGLMNGNPTLMIGRNRPFDLPENCVNADGTYTAVGASLSIDNEITLSRWRNRWNEPREPISDSLRAWLRQITITN